jgi:hypothetical protein
MGQTFQDYDGNKWEETGEKRQQNPEKRRLRMSRNHQRTIHKCNLGILWALIKK